MNIGTLRVISLIFGVALLGGASRPCLGAGDRNLDTNVVYPTGALVQNGGRVINMQSPPAGMGIVAATGDGATDDTGAFQSAYNFIKNQYFLTSGSSSYIIYIPNGTYRVTQTLIYSGTAVYLWPAGCDINNLRLIGQSRAGTVIKLDGTLPAFQSKSNPMPVIRYQHPSTPFNNVATENLCENLTVNVGYGNPGAVAIQFQGANSARMSNVKLTSGDGGGLYGLWFPVGSVQAYLKDITITGFDDALYVADNAENSSAFEHLTCTNQHVAAISILGGGVNLRDMVSNQSAYHVPAVQFSQTGGSVVLLDSQLNGGSSTAPAVVITGTQQDCFARNTSVSGYSVAVQNKGTAVVSGSFISEYCAYPVTTVFAGQDTHSYALAVQDTPETPWETNLSNWVNVEDHRGGGNSDTATIQAAFAAAATGSNTVVYFPHLSYNITQAINVPACVTRVDCMFCNFTGNGYFQVNAASANPVTFEGKMGWTQIEIAAARTVVGLQASGNLINTQSAPITTFSESCPNMGAGNQFCTSKQTVYARSINDENQSGTGDIVATGGLLWVFGFKTENKPVPSVFAPGGGVAEVLGGYVNCVAAPGLVPMISNSNSSICFTGFTNMNQTFPVAISETRGSTVLTASNTQFPLRGGGYEGNFEIPLYVGGLRPSGPYGQFQGHQDVGGVAAAGSAINYTGSTFFVDGSGDDIWNGADAFQFVDSTWTGDGQIIAQVNSIDDSSGSYGYSKGGVMFRDGTSANGMFVDMVVTNYHGVWMQDRTSANANAVNAGGNANLRPPYWVKLERTGASSFVGSVSVDGNSWTQLGTATVNIPSAAYAGLCVTAHNNNGTLSRSIMSNVSLLLPAPVITSALGITATTGEAFNYQIAGSYSPTSYGATGLPGGLSVNGAGLISGTPTATGTFASTVNATNAAGTGSATLTITVTVDPPAAPTGLSEIAGDAQVALTWNQSSGATGYNVKSSLVSGGTYAVIASNIAATGYTDATVTNGTTYYYVVSAVNAGGASANSAEIGARPTAPITSGESAVPLILISGSSAQLTVKNSVIGHTYQLQSTASLSPPTWVNIGPPQSGNGGALVLQDIGGYSGGTQAFFRVLIQQ